MGFALFLFVLFLVVVGVRFLVLFFTSRTSVRIPLVRDTDEAGSELLFALGILFFTLALLGFNNRIAVGIGQHVIVLVASILALALAYRLRLVYTLGLGVLGSTLWWFLQNVHWSEVFEYRSLPALAGLGLVGAVVYGLGAISQHRGHARFAKVYIVLATLGMSILLLMLSTEVGLREIQAAMDGAYAFGANWLGWVVFVGLVVAGLGLYGYAFSTKAMNIYEILAHGVIAIVLIALLFFTNAHLLQASYFSHTAFGSFADSVTPVGYLWGVILNIAAFAYLVSIILLGYIKNEGMFINIGSLMLFVFIAVKYFDWFFTFLDKSVFFITAGLLLLLVGWLMEKGRRYMLKEMKEAH